MSIIATAVTLVGGGALDAAAAVAPSSATQVVSYQGLQFTVPSSWPVVQVSPTSTTCVRFDQHAVYLGAPGANQNCPASVVGRTEALLVQPDGSSTTALSDSPVAHQITGTAPGVRITATYGQDDATVRQILASAALPVATPATTHATPKAVRPFASSTTMATEYNGSGFDACATPSGATMNAWLASPYRSVGIYFGGSDRGCAQPNLTASWISQQVAAGWHFQPLYAGPQASKGEITAPASQAVAAADDAVTQAAALGFGPGSLLYYDMEAYPTTQSSAAVGFMSAWTSELHARGYQSGMYGSMNSTVADLVNNYSNTGFTEPDVLFFARYNGTANTSDTAIPANEWANDQRAHQYNGGHDETYGGVTIGIDNDYLDVNLGCNGPTGSVLARSNIAFCNWTYEADPTAAAIAVGSDSTQLIIGGDGAVYAKSGIGLYGWTKESDPGVRAIATNNGVQMIIGGDGSVYAKSGIGLYGWVKESDPGVRTIAVGSDGTQMIIGGDGAVYAKTGIGLYGWTKESDPGVQTIATNDGIQMIIGGDGAAYAKTGIYLYGWVKETDPGVHAIAVGSDTTQMIIGGDGTADAKTGIGLYGWVKETDPGVQTIATNNGIQMIIGGDGSVDAKTGIYLYGWIKETDPPARSIAIGADGTQLTIPN